MAVLGSSGAMSRPPGRCVASSSLTLPLGAALGSDGQSDARPLLRLLGVGALQAAAAVSVPCLSDPVRAPTKLVSEGRATTQRAVQYSYRSCPGHAEVSVPEAVQQHPARPPSLRWTLAVPDHCAVVWFDCADGYVPLFP